MAGAQNCVYGSQLSPPRQRQIQEALESHLSAVTLETDSLFQMYLPQIAAQTGKDITGEGGATALYTWVKGCELLRRKGEKVSMGKYQQPVHAAKRSLPMFSVKAYLYNTACIRLGFKGADRMKAPAVPAGGVAGALEPCPEKLTLKEQMVQPWSEQCANQLDRAAYLFGNTENAFLQAMIVRVLLPTANFHSRRAWGTRGRRVHGDTDANVDVGRRGRTRRSRGRRNETSSPPSPPSPPHPSSSSPPSSSSSSSRSSSSSSPAMQLTRPLGRTSCFGTLTPPSPSKSSR